MPEPAGRASLLPLTDQVESGRRRQPYNFPYIVRLVSNRHGTANNQKGFS
jgi:hypothetical protein